MLLKFSVQNFRSIYERQDINFVASRFASLQSSLFKERRVPSGVLPVVVLYGANAAGKSNILRAMHYMYRAVVDSHNKWRPQSKLTMDTHFFHKDEASEFECEFLFQKIIYRFGFSLNEERFLKEYLYAGKKLVYSRNGNRYRLGEQLTKVDQIKRNTRPNALFISAAAQNNHPLLKKIYAWFSSWDTITDDRSFDEALAGFSASNDSTRSFLAKALSLISPDIVRVDLANTSATEEIPQDSDRGINAFLEDRLQWLKLGIVHESSDKKQSASLILAQESKGTQAYFTLANSIVMTLAQGAVLLLDEADQSLHPTLLRSIVCLFQNPETNPYKAQLVFNTHDTTLLSPEIVRPDQVWFVEKNSKLESYFYCLSDFDGIRSETKAQRAYLEGRFGALPFLEDQASVFGDYLKLVRGDIVSA